MPSAASVSGRVTASLRQLGHALRPSADHGSAALETVPQPLSPGRFDLWLTSFWDEQLAPIDAACADAGADAFALFRGLSPDLWALLLTQDYAVYPNIKRLLPEVPAPDLQVVWNGASGVALAAQSCAFYERLLTAVATHGRRPLSESRVLDFGCGWGRLARFLARDLAADRLHGCDPVEPILDVARDSRVPARLALSGFVPERVPFDLAFDLVYAFSVFTHLSERAHEASLRALHAAIAPGGLLVVTIRPPEYLRTSELLHPVLAALGPEPHPQLAEPLYLFAAHDRVPLAVEEPGRELTYGETVITLAYVRERWTERFELLDVDLLVGDPHQVMLTLRRR